MCQERNTQIEIQHEVLCYLSEHPDALGSVETIRRWWLLQRLARYSNDLVQQALNGLVAAQLIERRVLCDGREVYARVRAPAVSN